MCQTPGSPAAHDGQDGQFQQPGQSSFQDSNHPRCLVSSFSGNARRASSIALLFRSPVNTLRTWLGVRLISRAASAMYQPRLNSHCGEMRSCTVFVIMLDSLHGVPYRGALHNGAPISKNRLSGNRIMAREKSVNKLFINRLTEAMGNKGLKQSDLAYMANISQGTISEYLNPEKGRAPGAAELGRMAQSLGVSMGWLWGVEGSNSTETIPYLQIINRLQGKVQFAKKTFKGALDYLNEEIEEDKVILCKILPTTNNPSNNE